MKQKHKVTLSKLGKIWAARYINPHQRGAYIRARMDAENTAFMSKFAKPGREQSEST
jgi:hypothetical protein